MTEDDLVVALREICEAPEARGPAPRRIALGIGDDAAAWQPSRSHRSVLTSDALVDGVHFLRERTPARAIGHRAMASNLSDVAAMGARPVLATVVLAVAPDLPHTWILDCYRGMAGLAAGHGARIVGGDLVRAPVTMLSISVVGEVAAARLATRSGAMPGDVLAVTGPLGASRAGLELVLRDRSVDAATRAAALAAYETPEPRVREGRWLAASSHVRAMMDLSDGLSTDVARLARASGCGVAIDAVPIAAAARDVAHAVEDDGHAYALDGGEDFELLVAVRAQGFDYLARAFERRFRRPLLRVGRLTADGAMTVDRGAGAQPLVAGGWDHLANGGGLANSVATKDTARP